jgi:hypothetical protein
MIDCCSLCAVTASITNHASISYGQYLFWREQRKRLALSLTDAGIGPHIKQQRHCAARYVVGRRRTDRDALA